MTKQYSPTASSDEQDPQRQKVYDAEELAYELFCDHYDEPERLKPENVLEFSVKALTDAGMFYEWDEPPVFRFDLADDCEYVGAVIAATREIVLHPRMLDPWTVLHEVAHWKTPGDLHGPMFCEAMYRLVGAGLGEPAAEILLEQYKEQGVAVADMKATVEEAQQSMGKSIPLRLR